MGIITLISDWGLSDYYVAAVKGMIYKFHPEAKIVDITHQIQPFNSAEAAYILKNTYKSFPDGTVHIIGINTEESLKDVHIVAYYDKQYFIGTDDGIFSLIFDDEPDSINELDIRLETSSHTFSSRDRFAKAAALLLKNGNPEELGPLRQGLVKKMLFNPVINEDSLKGMIIHIDNYNNLITNITKNDFKKFTSGAQFEISFRSQKYKVSEIQDSYGDVRPGEMVALFTGNGILEIAINKGKAASLLGIHKNDPILITRLRKSKK
ncbi:MAG: SAM-dependent chlorinase/fluorinase [Bacteroidetes bacterium]|nr:SAM-dependent chlorinase/fluorinase [Bacteroidota bacterium]